MPGAQGVWADGERRSVLGGEVTGQGAGGGGKAGRRGAARAGAAGRPR